MSVINQVITNTVTDHIIHTAEDTKTLVRARMDLLFVYNQTGTHPAGSLLLEVRPRGTQIATPARYTTALDQVVHIQEIARLPVMVATSSLYTLSLELDTKAMRKLREDDEIVLSHVCSVGSGIKMMGTISLWFKE